MARFQLLSLSIYIDINSNSCTWVNLCSLLQESLICWTTLTQYSLFLHPLPCALPKHVRSSLYSFIRVCTLRSDSTSSGYAVCRIEWTFVVLIRCRRRFSIIKWELPIENSILRFRCGDNDEPSLFASILLILFLLFQISDLRFYLSVNVNHLCINQVT